MLVTDMSPIILHEALRGAPGQKSEASHASEEHNEEEEEEEAVAAAEKRQEAPRHGEDEASCLQEHQPKALAATEAPWARTRSEHPHT